MSERSTRRNTKQQTKQKTEEEDNLKNKKRNREDEDAAAGSSAKKLKQGDIRSALFNDFQHFSNFLQFGVDGPAI